jgi:succinate-semialdehyde dehydrogenase/glutarate-semialdehyde dehydrogenase
MIIKSINPYSQAVIAEHEVLTNAQLAQKIELSEKAFKNWRNTTFQEKADKMKKLANILRARKEELGLLITNEMGKILSEGVSEVEKSAGNCDFYAENAEKMLKDVYYDTPFKSMSVYDPSGAIFAVMPWNYPFWQVLRYAAPAVMAGNVTILKHASNVQGCAKAIENAFLEAGFPEGVFQQVTINLSQVESIIASDIVSGVTLTGSEMAGSTDVEKAATIATQSRMLNAGQACICAKRFIVTEKIGNEFAHLFAQKINALNQGNPLQNGINMGPLAKLEFANTLSSQLEKSLQQGAKILVGGEQDNCNFQPTLIDFVDSNNIAFQEETFGPLATIIRAKDENDAIAIANNHRYGLASAIWTEDREKAYKLARRIEAGNVFVNSLVRSDSRIPFGGIKKSGYGRELSDIGMKEFMNMKSIIIE